MNREKLKNMREELEKLGTYIFSNEFDAKSAFVRLIVILKDVIEDEINKRKYDSSFI